MVPARILQPNAPEHIQAVRVLFQEYAAELGSDFCFLNFAEELASLPGKYIPPAGCLLLAMMDDEPAGCVALRQLEPSICEMKRLYVRAASRGTGLGRTLTERIIERARDLGYRRMRLDTIPGRLKRAAALYSRMGFIEIPPYYENPIAGVVFMELVL